MATRKRLGRMMAPVLLLPLGMAPLAARALGLGELRVTSALGQPLQARIELIGASAAEAELAKVSLASAEEHRRLGVDGSLAGVALRFAVKVGDNGRSYVSVTSYEPVREPYLDFVVEAISPSGQVARHYTILLDPAGSPPLAPATSPAPAWSPQPVPAVLRPPRAFNPFANVGQPRAGATYGPVPPGVTLWTVARRVRPAGADLDAVMAAIVRANPQAFVNGDPARLKAGVKLTIPEARELRQSPPVAAAPVAAQAAPSPAPAATEVAPVPASTAAAGPVEAPAPAPAAEVRVLRSEDAKAPAAPVSGTAEAGGAPRVQLLEEALDAAQQQNEALQQRLGALEEQIKTLTELVKTGPGGEAGAAAARGTAGGAAAPPSATPALPAAVAPAPAAAAPAGGVLSYVLAAGAGLGLGGLLLWRQRRRGRGDLAAPPVVAAADASGAATPAVTPPTQVEWVEPAPAAPAPAAAAPVVPATESAAPASTAASAGQPPADGGFGDPVDTQIDLLTAYVGMADGASARQVFAEIQRTGTPAQVAQAAAVLARLDA